MKLALYLLFINILTFAAYWADKRAAQARGWRWPESSLLLLGFLGGWPAGFIAQRKLRHKNRKTSFQVKFWLLVVVELALVAFPPAALKILLTRAFA